MRYVRSPRLNIAGIQSASVSWGSHSNWMITLLGPDLLKCQSSLLTHLRTKTQTKADLLYFHTHCLLWMDCKDQGLLCFVFLLCFFFNFLITGRRRWKQITGSSYCLISAANRRSVEECNALPPSQGAAKLYCEPQACFYSKGVMWGALVNHSPSDRERSSRDWTAQPCGSLRPWAGVSSLVANTKLICVFACVLIFYTYSWYWSTLGGILSMHV